MLLFYSQYLRDQLGWQTSDIVAALGSGVDSTVLRIDTVYEVRGMVSSVKSYDTASGGTLVNQVLLSYNDFEQLASEIQDPTGTGSGSLYLTVLYGYADGSANTIALQSMNYPNGRVLNYQYTAADDVALNRVTSLQFTGDSAAAAAYAYFGLASFASVTSPQPGLSSTLASGTSYPGFDIFGRVVNLSWVNSSSVLQAGLGYGYDLSSDRIYRADLAADAATPSPLPFDELYDYDGVKRLVAMARGTLTPSTPPAAPITGATLQQSWNLDSTGNWSGFGNSDYVTPSNTLAQQRTSNTANEIIGMAATLGGVWAAPGYDRNGNMTTMPQPNTPTSAYTTTVDAWNRLMTVSSGSAVQTNGYDGLNRRTLLLVSGVTTYFYYSNQWQVLEERLSSGTGNPSYQYVWGLRYIDDIVRRDTFSGSSVSLSLYALQDANWNVVAICDDTGSVLERFVYTPYGVCTFLNPDFSAYSGTNYGWTVLFTGRVLDSATGLLYYRERYYLPALGVFVSRDPIGYAADSFNLFEYAYDAPTTFTDPSGSQPPPRTLQGMISVPVAGATSDSVTLRQLGGCCRPITVGFILRKANYALAQPKCLNWFKKHGLTGNVTLSVNCHGSWKPNCWLFPSWTIPVGRIGLCENWLDSFTEVGFASLMIHEAAHHFCPIIGAEECAVSAQDACASDLI